MTRLKVKSSNINSIGYLHNLLEIEFKNRNIYQFKNVSEKTHLNLMNSVSKGAFFYENIKGKFPYKQINSKT